MLHPLQIHLLLNKCILLILKIFQDRPSIEIYRPGMGKFSKQRLEKEKALGSSTEVDSPSHSPSPTPKSKLIS